MEELGAGGMTPLHIAFPRHRFSAEIISHAVWLYHMFSLSLRDVELILAERGVVVTHESLHYVWRAVDEHGVVLDILVQERRNGAAAGRFFKRPLQGLKYTPRRLVTDGRWLPLNQQVFE